MGGAGFTETTREWVRRLRGLPPKHEEARMLRPVALAGASRRSDASSRLCGSFATTADLPTDWSGRHAHGLRRKALSDGADVRVEWRQCQMCERNFVAGVTPYRDYCSLDCKSASLLEQPVFLTCD